MAAAIHRVLQPETFTRSHAWERLGLRKAGRCPCRLPKGGGFQHKATVAWSLLETVDGTDWNSVQDFNTASWCLLGGEPGSDTAHWQPERFHPAKSDSSATGMALAMRVGSSCSYSSFLLAQNWAFNDASYAELGMECNLVLKLVQRLKERWHCYYFNLTRKLEQTSGCVS